MLPEQQELEQAIANVDRIVAEFQCDRKVRVIAETAWKLVADAAREPRPAQPAKVEEPTPPQKT